MPDLKQCFLNFNVYKNFQRGLLKQMPGPTLRGSDLDSGLGEAPEFAILTGGQMMLILPV